MSVDAILSRAVAGMARLAGKGVTVAHPANMTEVATRARSGLRTDIWKSPIRMALSQPFWRTACCGPDPMRPRGHISSKLIGSARWNPSEPPVAQCRALFRGCGRGDDAVRY